MLWPVLLYLSVGFAVAAVTMRVFPPIGSFRPKASVVLAAWVVFSVLWPVLVLLTFWYLGAGYYNRSRFMARIHDSHVTVDLSRTATSLQQLPATKPR